MKKSAKYFGFETKILYLCAVNLIHKRLIGPPGAISMKATLFTLLFCFATLCAQATNVSYTADNSTIFANPERGFYYHTEKHVSKSSPYCLYNNSSVLSEMDDHRSSDKGTLVLIVYYLDQFLTKATLPSEILNGFDRDMQVLRDKGMKCVLRFAYAQYTYKYAVSPGDSIESAADAELNIALGHLAQYKSHLKNNADVIYVVQAGIVGAWGEWYYSDNFGNQTSHMNDKRKTLIDSLLKFVPEDRYIQLRTPLFKTEYIGNTYPLTAAEAYKNTPKARIGHHNDAFLFDYDNMGTYNDTSKQKPYLAKETLYVPMGGECDVYDEDLAAIYCTREKTIADMSRLHWTYINKGYAEETTGMWRNNGTFDELNIKMGYRYQLVSGSYSDQVEQGAKLSVNMQIKNVGFAPLYNERPAYIVLKNNSKTYKLKLATDPRTWLPNGVVTTVNEQITVPASVATGTYQLYLYLPDAYASIADNPKYAVRFANSSVWDSSTGMNKLNASVTVTQGSGTQPIDPGDAIILPATLNKANVNSYSEDMTWYKTDYFDFGPEDNSNLDRWAEWQVYLKYPGIYNISDEATGPDAGPGHSWIIQLLNGSNIIAQCQTDSTWAQGPNNYSRQFDLSDVDAEVYTLRIKNGFEWAQPKLQSLTLQYDGDIPTDEQDIHTTENDELTNGQAYDILGRPVDKSYRGIIILNGKKYMILTH